MTSENLTKLTEQELMQEEKKQKSSFTAFKILMGLMVVAAVWNATHKGALFISCLPLFFMSFLANLDKNYKAVQSEIESRKSR
jgi:hypothetical protein